MCSFCTMSVEKALKRYPGIDRVMVNLVHGIVMVEADTSRISRAEVAEAVQKLGYDVSETEGQQFATDEALHSLIRRRGAVGMTLAIAALLVDPLNLLGLAVEPRAWFSFAVAAIVLLWVGFPILRKTLLAARQRVINANVLLSAAAWGSFIVGTVALFDPRWPNFLPVAAWLMALHLFFGYFKLDTRKKAAEAVRKLLSLQPQRARVERNGAEAEVATADVAVTEVVIIKPGERIPLDGEVLEGTASVDESSFTGESVPATREPGSGVIGGTLNLDGFLRVRVTKIGNETFLSQIVRLMVRIAERKPPLELLADRLMNYYGPVVFAVAALAFVIWIISTGGWIAATVVLLTVVIMGYPCALGISTPMLAAIAGGKGISTGLLVKASEVFYELSETDTVVFDKTGTLTYGRPTVTDVVPLEIDVNELLALAGGLEAPSEHPLAQAIHIYTQREGATAAKVESFRAIPGKGVKAQLDGDYLLAGKSSFLEEHGLTLGGSASSEISALAAQGKTVVGIARGGRLVGLIALQDQPRPDARHLVETLRRRGVRTAMLTGDSQPVAEAIARQLGIDEIHAELLPDRKAAVIEELQKQGRKVAMVGDGINDAPALAQANVGLAIGAGTDVAIESAGVILISGKLIDVANALNLGRKSYRTLTGNVVVTVLFNAAGMTLAALGLITPLLAIGIMILSIFAILVNTLRVRNIRFEATAKEEADTIAELELYIPQMVCEGCADRIEGLSSPCRVCKRCIRRSRASTSGSASSPPLSAKIKSRKPSPNRVTPPLRRDDRAAPASPPPEGDPKCDSFTGIAGIRVMAAKTVTHRRIFPPLPFFLKRPQAPVRDRAAVNAYGDSPGWDRRRRKRPRRRTASRRVWRGPASNQRSSDPLPRSCAGETPTSRSRSWHPWD
ncbi:MAG: cation-translocating P-type ATPase [Verrucomicrobiales bacterium]